MTKRTLEGRAVRNETETVKADRSPASDEAMREPREREHPEMSQRFQNAISGR